jgi:predicted acyl esterase
MAAANWRGASLHVLSAATAAILAALLCAEAAHGAPAKVEKTWIPARDGTLLYTLWQLPEFVPPGGVKLVLERTPYGATGLFPNAGKHYVEAGLAYVGQDMRGRGLSGGTFNFFLDSANDAYDTMEFLVQQSWSNGEIYSVGISADAITGYTQPVDGPVWLNGSYLTVGTAVLHGTVFPYGAYIENSVEGWLTGIGEASYIPTLRANEADGAHWAPADMRPHWGNVRFPSIHVSGWFDLFNWETMIAAEFYDSASDPAWRGQAMTIVDPLGHCPGGAINFEGARNWSDWAGDAAVALFKGTPMHELQAKYGKINTYVMGSGEQGAPGNFWASLIGWPQATPLNYYLGADGTLATQPPAAGSASLIYNPANPLPTWGGNLLVMSPCGPQDQLRFVGRPDVLVFVSEPLSSPLLITGSVVVSLAVSSNATDTDFMVKLVDVWANGTHMLVQDNALRMRWLANPQSPTPITPGAVYNIQFTVANTSFIFNAGHRVGVHVTSSNYPRFSANPNNGLPLSQTGPNITALNSVFFGPNSFISLPFVPLERLVEASVPHKRDELAARVGLDSNVQA